MQIDPEDLRNYYRSLSDGEFAALDRKDLVDVAQRIYDSEIARRKAARGDTGEDSAEPDEDVPWRDQPLTEDDAATPPEWLENAACACNFTMHRQGAEAQDVAQARAALRAAGIPCYVVVQPADADAGTQEYCLMVPGALNLHATSVLDREIFNPQLEESWRAHFAELSDQELMTLDPKIFCAGFLDRAERLKRVYEEEAGRRKLKPKR
jgi:hypothetical protein